MECTSYSVKANLKRQLEKWYRSCHYVSCVSFIVNLSPLQLHRIEVLGNIVILNQGSFKGESWSSLWPVLAASPSVISHQSPLTEREQSFLTILCDCYGCERVGIHEEIDFAIKSRSEETKSFSNHFHNRNNGQLGNNSSEWCCIFVAI